MARRGFLSRLSGGLARDERGTSVIELAIVAPILSLMTMGIIDISTGYSRRLELVEAVDRTLGKLTAENFKVPGTVATPDFSSLKADAAAAAKVPQSSVTVVRWLECDGVEQTDFAALCPDKTTPECMVPNPPASADCKAILARYVQVNITTSFRPMFGRLVAPRADGTYPLVAEAAVRIQ